MSEPGPDLAAVAAIMALTARAPAPECFRAIEALAARTLGPSMFTVNRTLAATQEVERVYSGNEAAYPVGGRKQKRDTEWAAVTLLRGEIFVAQGEAAIRRHFDDHERILGLGIREIVNVPVLLAGRSMATMNLSRPAVRFTDAERPALAVLAGLLLPLVLGPPG